MSLSAPRDGRINGFGVTGSVLGAATVGVLDGRSAGAGRQWWIVGLRWQVDQQDPAASVSVTVDADQEQGALPLPSGAATAVDTGPLFWAVSVPTAAPDVVVELTSGVLSQSFSLSHLARPAGEAPALYRTAGQWQTTVPVNQDVVRTVPAFSTLPPSALTVGLHQVVFSEFGPAGPQDVPPVGAGAWLSVQLSSAESDSAVQSFPNTVTADQVTLTTPGQAPVPTTLIPGGGLDQPGPGLFMDRYAFAVPASFTTGTLTVSLPDTEVDGSAGIVSTTTSFAPVSFAVTIPAATAPAVPAGAVTVPRHYATAGTPIAGSPSASPGTGGRSSSGTSWWPAAAVIAVVVLVGAGLVLRRRSPSRPATADRPQMPAWLTASPRPPAATTTSAPGQTTAGSGPATGGWVDEPAAPARTAAPVAPADHPPDPEPPPVEGVAGVLTSYPGHQVTVTPVGRPQVLVLGPVRVERWQREPQRAVVTDLVVFLACHPDRPVSTDRLRAALSGPAADLSEETLRSYASMARRSIGAECLPVSTDRGYVLVGVDCDWTRFQDLLDHTAGVDAGRERALLDEAVGLVRGRAFPDRCRWAETEGLPQVIDLTVARTAARLAGLHLAAGDPGRAGWAAGVGLGVAPTDEALAAAVLRAGAASGHLASSWERIRSGWADADLDLPATLIALHAELAHPT